MANRQQRAVTIAIVAGEASGDFLGGHLVESLKQQVPAARFVGIGGPKMQAAGVESLFPMEKLAVRGYAEVLRHYPEIMAIRSRLAQHFAVNPPDVFIGVDAPDFNLGLEARLKARGIPTVHYVSPSIWAWRGERIHFIKRAVSKILTLFPFEAKIYQEAGVPGAYVGHPLADLIPEVPDVDAARESFRIGRGVKVVALLPGSRQSELRYMGRLFIEAAKLIWKQVPAVQFLVPLASRETRALFEEEIYRAGGEELPITVLFGHAQMAMTAADAVLVASGTATLEAALLKKPMVISYRISPLTLALMRRFRRLYIPYVGLPNIMAGKYLVPEILQEDATPENLAQAVSNILTDRVVGERLAAEFGRMHRLLKQNNAQRTLQAIMPYLQ